MELNRELGFKFMHFLDDKGELSDLRGMELVLDVRLNYWSSELFGLGYEGEVNGKILLEIPSVYEETYNLKYLYKCIKKIYKFDLNKFADENNADRDKVKIFFNLCHEAGHLIDYLDYFNNNLDVDHNTGDFFDNSEYKRLENNILIKRFGNYSLFKKLMHKKYRLISRERRADETAIELMKKYIDEFKRFEI